MNSEKKPTTFKDSVKQVFRDTGKTCVELYKIMIPIVIIVKILQELDLIRYLAVVLNPFMKVIGLPPEMGLAWATAMVTSIYGGMAVLVVLIKDCPMTAAQLTILGSVMLVAHALPLEGQICRKAGPKFSIIVLFRILVAEMTINRRTT